MNSIPEDSGAVATRSSVPDLEGGTPLVLSKRCIVAQLIMSDLPSPISHAEVYLALRRAARTKGRRPKQVLGRTQDLLEKILAGCPDSLSGKRDAALVGVGNHDRRTLEKHECGREVCGAFNIRSQVKRF